LGLGLLDKPNIFGLELKGGVLFVNNVPVV
jgi:hypothetical protein